MIVLTLPSPARIGTWVPCLVSFLTLCYRFFVLFCFKNSWSALQSPVSAVQMLLAISWGESNLPAFCSQAEWLSLPQQLSTPNTSSGGILGSLPHPCWNFDWLEVVLVCAGHPSCWVAVWCPGASVSQISFPPAPILIVGVGWLV